MADRNQRNAGNAAGRFYVDDSCCDCDLCREVAPNVFRRDEVLGLSIVAVQPITLGEMALAEEAVASCPTESIGRDGDEV